MVKGDSRRRGNLPAELTATMGRRAETAEVKRRLSTSRLVTLTGTGGVGKTRLALHVARQLRAPFSDGVWLVSLAELNQPDLLADTVLSAMTEAGHGAGIAELTHHIGHAHLLLVLDNCEHLADSCAKLASELLKYCPNLRVLTTSREPLLAVGETLYPVPPLSLPRPGQKLSAGEIHRFAAAQLFIERATEINPAFSLTPDDEQALIELCQHLDGLPLAIELAAARTRELPVRALLERQHDRFRLLSRGSRTAPRRQQTLRAAVDYSYDFCAPQARRLWARMSVFVGGADLDALETVCAGDGLPSLAVHPALIELVDKSVVTFDGQRYHMLETIREYGHEFLPDNAPGKAHRDYFAGLAAEIAVGWFGPDQASLLGRVLAEHANVRAALEFCLADRKQVRAGLRMAGDLWAFWIGCGLQHEGRLWLDRLLAADAEPGPERVAALFVNSHLANFEGEWSYALPLLDECDELAARFGDQAGLAHAAFVRAQSELFGGDGAQAVARMAAAVELERQVPDPNPFLTTALVHLGATLFDIGEVARASQILEEARDLCAAAGDQLIFSWALVYLGLAAIIENRIADTKALLIDALERKRALNDILGMDVAIEFLAWTALEEADAERAARLLGASTQLAKPLGTRLAAYPRLHGWHEERARQAREKLGARAFDAAVAGGRQLSKDEAIDYALGKKTAQPAPGPGELSPLTRREREIAQLVATGKTNRQIAIELVITPRTVDAHVEHILTKLGFTSRTQVAAAFAAADLGHSD